jgi:dTMP kinase
MSRFVVIEGIDGAGTTTQLGRMIDWLGRLGLQAHPTGEPTDRVIGRIIRQTLQRVEGAPSKACLPWLFAADRSDHITGEIKPLLDIGTWVVSDRYFHSSLAYQTLDLPFDEVLALNARFPVPDLTLYLTLDVETALSRIKKRDGVHEVFETGEILRRVSDQYAIVNQRLRARGDLIIDIDATKSQDRVFEAIQETVRAHLL